VTGPVPSIRLDTWLWQARFCKSRAQAARLVAAGAVRVNSVRASKPATPLRIGDGLTFPQGNAIRVVRVLALGTRRGPALEARLLYADLASAAPATGGLEPSSQPVK
jgi:ribosome-associated heat shock protein Hsp15